MGNKAVINKCKVCSKETRNRVYCSIACRHVGNTKRKQFHECEVCSTVVKSSRRQRYCSPECYRESQRLGRVERGQVETECPVCGGVAKRYDKYCSRKCAYSDRYANTTLDERRALTLNANAVVRGKKLPREKRSCTYCGSDFYRLESSSSHFCRRSCYDEFRKEEQLEKICVGCSEQFTVLARDRSQIYCDRTCYYSSNLNYSKGELILGVVLEPRGFKSTVGDPFFVRRPGRTRIPDWVNSETKQIVEFFGTYWHRHDRGREDEIIQWYRDAGWECEIVWEDELEEYLARERR